MLVNREEAKQNVGTHCEYPRQEVLAYTRPPGTFAASTAVSLLVIESP